MNDNIICVTCYALELQFPHIAVIRHSLLILYRNNVRYICVQWNRTNIYIFSQLIITNF